VASNLAIRIARVSKEAGRPLPRFSDDDVIDYQVAEAVTMRRLQSDAEIQREAAEKRKLDEWRKGKPGSGLPGGS
jgi:hypothetical protein